MPKDRVATKPSVTLNTHDQGHILVPLDSITAIVTVDVRIDSLDELREAVDLLKKSGLTSTIERMADGISVSVSAGGKR